MTSPRPDCNNPAYSNPSDSKDYLLDGDRACYVFESLSSTVDLRYRLNCSWYYANQTNRETDPSFTYWLDTPSFKLSAPTYWTMRFKLFNFNRLSDMGATYAVALTRDQLAGSVPARISFELNSIADKYWHGNRIYGELRWNVTRGGYNANGEDFTSKDRLQNRTTPRQGQNTLHRIFLDSPAYTSSSTYSAKTDQTALVVGLIAGAIALVIIVYCGVRIFQKKRKSKEKREDERQQTLHDLREQQQSTQQQ